MVYQKERKIKIIHIINNLSVGGAEKMLLNLISCPVMNSFDIAIFSLQGRGKLSIEIERLGIPIFYFGLSKNTRRVSCLSQNNSKCSQISTSGCCVRVLLPTLPTPSTRCWKSTSRIIISGHGRIRREPQEDTTTNAVVR